MENKGIVLEGKNEVVESLAQKRLKSYAQKVKNKPKTCNQIFVSSTMMMACIGGKAYQCDSIEGYIKFPEQEYFEEVCLLENKLVISLLSGYKLIVSYGDKQFFRGYKKENTEGLILVLKIVIKDLGTEMFLVDSGRNEINPYFMLGDLFDEDSAWETTLMYDNLISIIKDNNKFKVVDVEEDEEDEEDE